MYLIPKTHPRKGEESMEPHPKKKTSRRQKKKWGVRLTLVVGLRDALGGGEPKGKARVDRTAKGSREIRRGLIK